MPGGGIGWDEHGGGSVLARACGRATLTTRPCAVAAQLSFATFVARDSDPLALQRRGRGGGMGKLLDAVSTPGVLRPHVGALKGLGAIGTRERLFVSVCDAGVRTWSRRNLRAGAYEF